jgi:hypothetical protein
MIWAKLDSTNVVANIESATSEWITQYSVDHPDGEYRYVTAHAELTNKSAGIGFSYDEETTWFIPLQPGPEWYFDRELWEWVDPNAPEEEEESGVPDPLTDINVE